MVEACEQERFLEACSLITGTERSRAGIGTLGEKTLHAVLKQYLEPCTANQEIKIGRYFADIQNEMGVTEIQTRSFNAMRGKLKEFLTLGPVTIVYPIAETKWLVWMDYETGELSKRNKSPKHGKPWDAFYELYKIKPFLLEQNLYLHLIFLDVVEYRNLDGWGASKKSGSSRFERIPIALKEELFVNVAEDYFQLIPEGLPKQFTTKDFKAAAKRSLREAQTALNVLTHVGAVNRVGKQGGLILYEKA